MATFFIHQKITAFVNQYWIHDGRSGEAGALLAFAHQKRLAFRERFLFFTDESKAQEAFHIQARQVLDFGASHDVVDSDGRALGVFRKAFGASLLRSTWEVLDPPSGQPIVVARERSVPVAIVRRLWGWIPYLGDAPFFIKYHFDLIDAESGTAVGEYFKVTRFRDHYRLTVDDRYVEAVDWRTFVSLGVATDALQGR